MNALELAATAISSILFCLVILMIAKIFAAIKRQPTNLGTIKQCAIIFCAGTLLAVISRIIGDAQALSISIGLIIASVFFGLIIKIGDNKKEATKQSKN